MDPLNVRKTTLRMKFRLNGFKQSPCLVRNKYLIRTIHGEICISVQSRGMELGNYDYVVFHISRIKRRSHVRRSLPQVPCIVICNFILNVLDVKGEKKFPRSFVFRCFLINNVWPDVEKSNFTFEEKYIKRSSILSNESEYIQDETLTVIVEGTAEEWEEEKWDLISCWSPENTACFFKVQQLEQGLKVYLRRESVHAHFLMEKSSVFREMWEIPTREAMDSCVLLRNEELPAILCLLVFIETKKLILYETSVCDLYKIADKYDIPLMVEECRKYFKKYMSINPSKILEFAIFYNDEYLKRSAESYFKRHSMEFPKWEGEHSEECLKRVVESLFETHSLEPKKFDEAHDDENLKRSVESYFEKHSKRTQNCSPSKILELATFYDDECLNTIVEYYWEKYSLGTPNGDEEHDDECLKRTFETYSKSPSLEIETNNSNCETRENIGNKFVCNTRPVSSNIINTKWDFEIYTKSLWQKLEDIFKNQLPEDLPYIESYEITDRDSFNFYQ